jgi:hypothetical protein
MEEIRLAMLPAGRALDLARKTSGWRERAPDDRDLSPDEVEAAGALARDLARASGEGPRIEANAGGAPFEARARVTIRRTDATAPEIVELGAIDPRTGEARARRSFDGAILRVDAATARKLLPRATAIRGRALWDPPLEGKRVDRVATSCDGVSQAIVRRGDAWEMTAPIALPADNALRVNLIDAVTRTKADAWIADADDGSFGLDGACVITLSVEMDGGQVDEKILFGKDGEGGVYARIAGEKAVFVVAKDRRELAAGWLVARPRIDAGLYADAAVHVGPARADEGFARPSLVIAASDAGADGATPKVTLGAKTSRAGVPGYFVRAEGTDATFFVDESAAESLFARAGKSMASGKNKANEASSKDGGDE